MKRHAIRPGKPPKAKKNAEGKPREAFEGLRNEPYRAWIRTLPCIVDGQPDARCVYADRQSDAAHVTSKARGSGDLGNLYPACRRHHGEQHLYGRKDFEREYNVNLRDIAGALLIRYEKEKGWPCERRLGAGRAPTPR